MGIRTMQAEFLDTAGGEEAGVLPANPTAVRPA